MNAHFLLYLLEYKCKFFFKESHEKAWISSKDHNRETLISSNDCVKKILNIGRNDRGIKFIAKRLKHHSFCKCQKNAAKTKFFFKNHIKDSGEKFTILS